MPKSNAPRAGEQIGQKCILIIWNDNLPSKLQKLMKKTNQMFKYCFLNLRLFSHPRNLSHKTRTPKTNKPEDMHCLDILAQFRHCAMLNSLKNQQNFKIFAYTTRKTLQTKDMCSVHCKRYQRVTMRLVHQQHALSLIFLTWNMSVSASGM